MKVDFARTARRSAKLAGSNESRGEAKSARKYNTVLFYFIAEFILVYTVTGEGNTFHENV